MGLPDLINFGLCTTEIPLICQAGSTHLQTKHWSKFGGPTGLINLKSHSTDFLPFPGLWLVEQFPCICRQWADWIGPKFYGPTTHYGSSPGLIIFWSCSTEFPLLPVLWLVKQFLCLCKQTIDWIEVKFDGPTHYGPSLAWLTFGHAALKPSYDYPPFWF